MLYERNSLARGVELRQKRERHMNEECCKAVAGCQGVTIAHTWDWERNVWLTICRTHLDALEAIKRELQAGRVR